MMTIYTQNGRKLQINRRYHLHISGSVHEAGTLNGKKCKLSVTTFNKVICRFSDGTPYETGDGVVERFGVIGEFNTVTCLKKASDSLQTAWENGATDFIVSIDTNVIDAAEAFDNFCREHRLTCVSLNELGGNKFDAERNARIWRTSNEFERRNILVADLDDNYNPNDFGAAYSTSLKKWQALHSA